MAVVFNQFAVSTSAKYLCTIPAGPVTATVTNNGASVLYIGSGSAVTTASGYELASGAAWTYSGQLTSAPQDVWAISASASTASVWINTPR